MRRLIFIIILIFVAERCFSHGVGYSLIKNGVGIKVFYEDIEKTPMSYSEVKIFSPQDKTSEFQTGVTDKNGCFVFLPDTKGKWRIVVNDGMGHGLVKEIEIQDNFKVSDQQIVNFSLWQKILIGISIIFGVTGILFYLATRRIGVKDAHS